MSHAYQHFLHRTRRLWTACRIGEHAAIGMLIGCAVAGLLLAVSLWRGSDGRTLAVVFPVLGALVGIILGFRTRPTLFATAVLADERLNTADLFGTALAVRNPADPWNAMLVGLANARCEQVTVAAIIPHRLSARTWSGVFLSLCGVSVMAILTNTSTSTQAAFPNQQPPSNWIQSLRQSDRLPYTPQARAEASVDSHSMPGDSTASQQSLANHSQTGHRDGSAADGSGGGSARTQTAVIAALSSHTAASSADSSGTLTAAGSGVASHPDTASDANTTGQVQGPSGVAIVPPWQSSNWPAQRDSALNAITQGAIPDGYRDMVRDYFERK